MYKFKKIIETEVAYHLIEHLSNKLKLKYQYYITQSFPPNLLAEHQIKSRILSLKIKFKTY